MQGVLKALKFEEKKLSDQVERAKEELQELEISFESMDIQVKEPPNLGKGQTICGNCHHRGHRNQSTNACKYDKCTDYSFCGIREKHPEYFSKINALKSERKKKKDKLQELESQVQSMRQFSTTSEHMFIKKLTPRLYKVDSGYKANKPKLMRDVRLLTEHLGGKIPTDMSDEKLKVLIKNCKNGLSIENSDSKSSPTPNLALNLAKKRKNTRKVKREVIVRLSQKKNSQNQTDSDSSSSSESSAEQSSAK